MPDSLVKAIGAVLSSAELDGAFVAAAISLPAAAELIGNIPAIDPLLLHHVRYAAAPSGTSSRLRGGLLPGANYCHHALLGTAICRI